jgi:hypothetical protein
VKAAVEAGDFTSACNGVANYYSSSTKVAWLRHIAPPPGNKRVGGDVDTVMLNDSYNFYGEVGRVPRNKDGGLDWYNTGPVDDVEFMYALNRHFAWDEFLDAWLASGNPEYSAVFDARVTDWAAHNLPITKARQGTSWRTLEAGIRSSTHWPSAFFGFQSSGKFKSSTRCAMVAALAEHGRYLHENGQHGNSNWRSMQWNGLATTALTMPELNNAEVWFAQAQYNILEDMEHGVYADGVEDEETAHYHRVALNSFNGFLNLVKRAGVTPDPKVVLIVERMFNYLAYSLDPSGLAPLNGDSDTDNNSALVLQAATDFSRRDWLFIATHGQNGTKPAGNASVIFPWAGQVMGSSTE